MQQNNTAPAPSPGAPAFPVVITDWINGMAFFALVAWIVWMYLWTRNFLMLAALVIFFFYEVGVIKFVFDDAGVELRYFYGRKKRIARDQIVRIVLKKTMFGKKIEVNWKKSAKKATRVFRISTFGTRRLGIPVEELVQFLRTSYGK